MCNTKKAVIFLIMDMFTTGREIGKSSVFLHLFLNDCMHVLCKVYTCTSTEPKFWYYPRVIIFICILKAASLLLFFDSYVIIVILSNSSKVGKILETEPYINSIDFSIRRQLVTKVMQNDKM